MDLFITNMWLFTSNNIKRWTGDPPPPPIPCLKYTLSEAEHISHWLVCWLVKVLVLLFDKSQRDHLLTLMSPAKMQCSQWELKLFGCQHSSQYNFVCEMF